MLRYRALLVDTEKTYARPVQAFFIGVDNIDAWAKTTLRTAGKDAYIVVYRVTELEIGTFKRTDYNYDQGSVPDIQPSFPQAGEPPA